MPQSKKHKKFRPDKKFWVRLLCAFLALLMVLSVATILIQFFAYGLYAIDDTEGYYTDDEGETLISVGLMYADGVTVGFETSAQNGFFAGYSDLNRRFTSLFELDATTVSVICDANLYKTGMTYSLTGSGEPDVGGWHVQISCSSFEAASLAADIAVRLGVDAFPACVNGEYYVRAGQYTNKSSAEAAVPAFTALGYIAAAAAPSDSALTVIDPSDDDILFEYDGGSSTTLALSPVQKAGKTAYLITPALNSYAGYFKYTRWISESASGVAVTNILPVEDYIKGVLPWEVSNESSQNLLRTFAIAARSFVMSTHKHTTFDVCNGTCCQVYKGLNRTNDNVVEAVDATAGTVLAYNDSVARVTYSSSTGGCTVAASEAWGQSLNYPYLSAVITPWENYQSVSNGSWTVALTSDQIRSRLAAAGYSGLTDTVVDVSIGELADGSSYVYSLIITDASGNIVTLRRTDAIRAALGLNSANFVVGKAGETLKVTDYSFNGEITEAIAALRDKTDDSAEDDTPERGVYVLSSSSDDPQFFIVAESVVLTMGSGIELNLTPQELSVLTADGEETIDITDAPLVSDSGTASIVVDSDLLPDLTAADAIVETTREVVAEGAEGSFVFIGRGWGHGVGLSQYGARDLAALGYDYETILSLYLPGTYLAQISDIIGD